MSFNALEGREALDTKEDEMKSELKLEIMKKSKTYN